MSEPFKALEIHCMFDAGRNAAGGIADVHVLADVNATELITSAEAFFAEKKDSAINSVQVFVAGSAGKYFTESYSPAGKKIRFCGHGALAAAWALFDQHENEAKTLEFASAAQSWSARRSDDESADAVLSFSQPVPVDCPVPEFVEGALGAKALAAAEFGGDDDYLLLELPDATSVQELEPDFAAISAGTRRALIVTAAVAPEQQPGCVFRYFAPQYGSPEDAATGSAAVQLAVFWSQRFGAERFGAEQLSDAGAYLSLGCYSSTVDLAARVGYR